MSTSTNHPTASIAVPPYGSAGRASAGEVARPAYAQVTSGSAWRKSPEPVGLPLGLLRCLLRQVGEGLDGDGQAGTLALVLPDAGHPAVDEEDGEIQPWGR